VYTGYITPRPASGSGPALRAKLGIGPDERLIVGSAGGGKAGLVLLKALLESFPLLHCDRRVLLRVFAGPYMPAEEFAGLQRLAGDGAMVDRFTPQFLEHLDGADLSVSMGGYNTSMNLLATGVPALVWPYPRDREQGLRAKRLAAAGAFTVLSPSDLEPKRLAGLIAGGLAAGRTGGPAFDLDGARRTAAWIRNCKAGAERA
jgi:predicted glycosyltransferase